MVERSIKIDDNKGFVCLKSKKCICIIEAELTFIEKIQCWFLNWWPLVLTIMCLSFCIVLLSILNSQKALDSFSRGFAVGFIGSSMSLKR